MRDSKAKKKSTNNYKKLQVKNGGWRDNGLALHAANLTQFLAVHINVATITTTTKEGKYS